MPSSITPEEFVDAVKHDVRDTAVGNVLAQLAAPSGRKPHPSRTERAAWFAALDDGDRRKVGEIAREAADDALFGLFCVLDGVRLIDERLRHGRLRLVFDSDGRQVVLSDNQAVSDLHDIFNAESGSVPR